MAELQTVFGIHAVESLIRNGLHRVTNAWIDDKRSDKKIVEIKTALQQVGISIEFNDKKTLDKLAKGGNHQGVVVAAQLPIELTEQALKKAVKEQAEAFYLVLDQVTDPHNLGACLRTALAVGVQGVIVPKDNACRLTATVCKVASGAAENIPVYRVTNLARTLDWLKTEGVWLSGAAGEADLLHYQAELTGSVAIVMGAEGKGLRRLTRDACDQLIKIPMSGQIESLNVSVATGVILYEAHRQRSIATN